MQTFKGNGPEPNSCPPPVEENKKRSEWRKEGVWEGDWWSDFSGESYCWTRGESWKPHPLSPSPVWGLQRDPSGSSLYFLQVGQWWPEEKGLAALVAEPGGVAALELSAPQSLPGPRMEPTSQYPDVGQQDDRASKESPRSCLREPAAWVRRPHLRNLGGGPLGPGGGVQGAPWNRGVLSLVVGTPGEKAHHGKPQRYTKAQRDRECSKHLPAPESQKLAHPLWHQLR